MSVITRATNTTLPGLRINLDPSYQGAVLYVSGYLDEVSVPPFREALYEAILRGYRDIIVDLSDTNGVSSVGIGALFCGLRRFGEERGRIVLSGCRPPLKQLLGMSGVLGRFPLYASTDEARSALFSTVTQTFQATRGSSAALRPWLRTAMAPLKMTPTETSAVEAAASEAFVNAIKHAARDRSSVIIVRLMLGSCLTVEVQDRGPGFEARQYFATNPETLHTGARGLGIHVMRNLMDRVEFIAGASSTEEAPAGTTVRLVKRLRCPAETRREI
ncbi:MAG TPA: ATP-binding protein [Armatimonadota bacterium]|nr:ATP-binding protein [Armatimonadota bacterium]